MSVQYTAISHDCKNGNFPMKNVILILFLLKPYIVGTRSNRLAEAGLTSTHDLCFRAKISFAQNIDRGYTLEPPR